MQDQMRTMLTTCMAQLNNPEIRNLVTNPQAMSTMIQIQQGMEQLLQVVPSFAITYGNLVIYLSLYRCRFINLFISILKY